MAGTDYKNDPGNYLLAPPVLPYRHYQHSRQHLLCLLDHHKTCKLNPCLVDRLAQNILYCPLIQ